MVSGVFATTGQGSALNDPTNYISAGPSKSLQQTRSPQPVVSQQVMSNPPETFELHGIGTQLNIKA